MIRERITGGQLRVQGPDDLGGGWGRSAAGLWHEVIATGATGEDGGDRYAFAHMHTVAEVLAYLFKEKERLEVARAYQKQLGYKKFIPYMKMEPDLKPLLKWLKPQYKTAIATNRTFTMPWVLGAFELEGYFDLVVTARDVDRPKPDPQPLIKILTHFDSGPHQAGYVGDSTLDEIAAAAAGIPLIAYNNRSLSAAFHIKRLKELEDILGD